MTEVRDLGSTIAFNARLLSLQAAAHYLTVVQGAMIRRAVQVTSQPLVLGRDPSCSFHLPDGRISRTHCEVELVGEKVLVRDLGSTNGTFVDGVRVAEERVLPLSSQIQIGGHVLRHELLSPEEIARQVELDRDLERARRYVEAMIPAPIESGRIRTAWCFVPSSVLGGDALGYHELEGGRFAFYVLDVCGHGVGSAMHSASVLNALRGLTLPETDFGQPSEVLERLNAAFQMDRYSGMYFSIFYAVLDPESRRLRYASAGHPPAILFGADGRIRTLLASKNPPIGALASRSFSQAEVSIEPGERLYAFSDGVYELVDGDGRDLGLADFEGQLARAGRDRATSEPSHLYAAACALSGSEVLPDDFTMLQVELVP